MESKEFIKWYNSKFDHEEIGCTGCGISDSFFIDYMIFEQLPFDCKWGVYLKYFDEKGVKICCEPLPFGEYHYQIPSLGVYPKDSFETRLEAQQEAVKKAFESISK